MSSCEWKKHHIGESDCCQGCNQGSEQFARLIDDDIMLAEKSPERVDACRSLVRSTACLLGAVLLGFMIVLMYSQIAHRRGNFSDQDIRKSWSQFRGIDDVNFEQEVIRSLSGDYVMYHVSQPGGGDTWILDNYSQGYRLMKMTSPFEQVCYLTALNATRSEATDDAGLLDEQPAAVGDRKKRQTTFYVDETQEVALPRLGDIALELCAGVQSHWVHPTTAFARSHEDFATSHGRDKRNVKKCVVSCCSMVCCCNQKWLQWQSTSMFNCHNVCHGCTSKSKMDVTNVC